MYLHYTHVFSFTNSNTRKTKIIENTRSYNLIDKNRCLIIRSLNTIGNQQEILTTRIISYLLNLQDHITDYNFTYIP
jgi:hypothetical protein